MKIHKRFLLFGLVLLIFGCKREDKVWQNNLLVPIFQSEMTLKDLITDSILTTNNDGSYNLVYDYTYQIDSVGNYLVVPDTVDTVNVKLQTLILDDRKLVDTFTLREMDPTSALLDGLFVPLTAYDIANAGGEQEIDVSDAFFKTAKFLEGFLDITLHNDLPVYVDQIVFQLANKNDGSIVVLDTFRDIPSFGSKTRSISLAGKQINGILLGKVLRVKTRASTGPVQVDADKGVRIEMNIRDLKPEYATAIFPAQTLVADTQEVTYRFGGPQITEMQAKSGFVKMKIFSTIEEEIVIDYSFPFSGENGDFSKPFNKQYRVPPAAPGTTQKIEAIFPLDGYVMRYQGKDPSKAPFANTVYSKLVASTVYSGKVRNLSLDDSVYIEFGLVDIVPEYAFGEFPSKTYDVTEPFDVKALKNVLGSIDLQNVSMLLTYENGFGMEALATVNSLKAVNNRTNKSTDLIQANYVGQGVLIRKATHPPFRPRNVVFTFNESNSNIEAFLETIPDQIIPDIKLQTKPNGLTDFTDFIFSYSYLKAMLRLEMPVTFAMNNLQFVRKKDFSMVDLPNYDRIKSGTFKLLVENDFPLEAAIELEFLDENDQVIESIFTTNNRVDAAVIPPGNEKTTSPSSSMLIAEVGVNQMNMIKNAKRIRIKSTFNTPSNNRTKIFDSYKINTKLIADFVYEQNL